MSFKTAGIIIVGDEIVKGHINDTNSVYMCKRFHAIGVKVCRIAIVPDNVDDIAEEVAMFSKRFNIVVTSGGIGPTHDDITYEGVAKGLDDEIVFHPEMAKVVRNYFPSGSNVAENPALKMAMIPKSSKLIYILPKKPRDFELEERNGVHEIPPKVLFPVVQVRNVYILPGMTEWMKLAFDHLQKLFENPEVNFYTMKLIVMATELNIIDHLNKAVHKYENSVIFGSYPSVNPEESETKITLESTSLDAVTDAYSYLKSIIPCEYLSDALLYRDMESVYELTNGSSSLSKAVTNSMQVVEHAYSIYKPEEVYLSFNGGKDCTALLHIIWAYNMKQKNTQKINASYLKTPDQFPEMEEFIKQTTERYNLNLFTDNGPADKEQLSALVKKHPCLKAIFLGTRRTDPYAQELKSFQMCDPDWPQLMRINPILDWSYTDVWEFLRVLAVPYCSLYDEGFTSLGNVKNTSPNPALAVEGCDGNVTYLPAYKLKQGSLERQGRS
ncbi:UNVERIFIED_CONTAM: hypothetical protein PYX00_008447 [Menopon gallinae]